MFAQERKNPPVVRLRLVQPSHQSAVTVDQKLPIELRDKIQHGCGVVACRFGQQTAFAQQPLVKPRLGQCGQQPNHRRHDARFLNELELSLEDIRRIVIEADDESTHDLQPRAWIVRTDSARSRREF